MLQVYAIPVSLYCAKLRILLRHKGLTWEETLPPGGYGSNEYKTHVPSGNLPALLDGDLLIADSEAIAEYLDEKFTEPLMLPGDIATRAKVRELSRFHDTRLEPAVRALFPFMPGREPAPDGFLESQSAEVSARVQQMVRMMPNSWPAGLMLCDCGFPITFAWLDELAPRMGFEWRVPKEITAYRDQLMSYSAVVEELADYTPKLIEFLDE